MRTDWITIEEMEPRITWKNQELGHRQTMRKTLLPLEWLYQSGHRERRLKDRIILCPKQQKRTKSCTSGWRYKRYKFCFKQSNCKRKIWEVLRRTSSKIGVATKVGTIFAILSQTALSKDWDYVKQVKKLGDSKRIEIRTQCQHLERQLKNSEQGFIELKTVLLLGRTRRLKIAEERSNSVA